MCAISFFLFLLFSKLRGTQRRFPPKCIENTFKAVQSSLDLQNCILSGANTGIDLVRRAKSEALDNIYSLLLLNIKSCNTKRRRQRDRGTQRQFPQIH